MVLVSIKMGKKPHSVQEFCFILDKKSNTGKLKDTSAESVEKL